MKILILKPSSLGDVVHALPVLRCLRRHLPESEIWWWIDTGLAPLLDGDPDLTGIVPFDRKRSALPASWPALWRSLRAQRRQRYDWIIDLQSLARSGLFGWLANGQFTIGLDDPREGARAFCDVIVPRPSPQTHAVDWYLEVLPKLNVPVRWDFDWLPRRAPIAMAVRRRWNVDRHRWIVLLPGARWLNKRWPVDYFAELVRRATSHDVHLGFVVLGDATDRDLGRRIAAAAPAQCLDLTGQTTLPEMVEWVRLSEFVISNDTGPMHIAAALGKPVLGLFGPTHPRRTGPYGAQHRTIQHSLPCVPCMKDSCANARPIECLRAITPAAVAGSVEAWLEAVRQKSLVPGRLDGGQIEMP